ncbi:linear gramicidin synthase subunit D-like [Ylistrum balloti]|uniref:linear gramicidin synthase subunit D-like n=1 Tax=Ylistrum balloti TaxID=509963 RepID=UPI002905DD81|nr:linear gramicidin synthase subunit D-like [Ylistrum balloti]
MPVIDIPDITSCTSYIAALDSDRSIPSAVIGEGNLLLSCLEYLTDASFTISAVFTDTPVVKTFCEEKKILQWKRGTDIEHALRDIPIDYLFSISNPRVLTDSVLQIPRKLSINYHDSPLPRYAGIHATSWAIINGESNHGISWHVIETGIDTGDILQTRAVKIDPDDSAFTLNMKCQEAAKSAFQILIKDVKQDCINRTTQPVSGRSYYGLHAIPPNIGVLNFQTSCTNICNLGRGLEFGTHDNALGSPKVMTSTGDFVLVTNVEESNCSFDEHVKHGTITEIVDDTLVVKTQGNSVLLSITKLDGSHLSPSEYSDLGISVGEKLSSNFAVDTENLTQIRKKETFWRRKLKIYDPTTFFRQRMNVVAGIIDVSTAINVKSIVIPLPVPNMNGHSFHTHTCELLMSAFVAFIGRMTCNSNVSLGILANKSTVPEMARGLYSDICPGVFTVDLQQKTHVVLHDLYEMIKTYREAQSFLVDAFYRYPELRGQKRTPHHNIAIGQIPSHASATGVAQHVLHDCNILLLFNDDGDEMHLMYKEKIGQDFQYISDVLQHFPTFLTTSDLNQPLHETHLVSDEELKQLYLQPLPFKPSTKSVYDVFEEQCRSSPNNIALRSSATSYTYNQCNELAMKVSCLLDATYEDERIIGLHFPNSMEYVVSVIGVLKTNRAFLPLPIDYPEERMTFTLRDAKVHSMLTTASVYENLKSKGFSLTQVGADAVQIDRNEVILVRFAKNENKVKGNENDFVHIIDGKAKKGGVQTGRILNGHEECGRTKNGECDADDFKILQNNGFTSKMTSQILDEELCYVMYTSGSTGRPKGVQVSHSGVVNLAKAQIELWSLHDGDVIAQFASIGFDATVSEIFTALFSGATLVTLSDEERLGQEFIRTLNMLDVNTITLPPSALNIYSPNDLPKLEKVVTAGEACSLGTALKWTVDNKTIRFFNAYGPTETTVCATCYEFKSSDVHVDNTQDLPIGMAIPGMSVYLFDNFMKPVPPDVVGEIYVGGIGVSKGYIGHAAEHNLERFVQNPMTDQLCLLYKTGDHAFQSNDGNITYIGRLDDMIKIRGQRVDLSEIEQVLIQHTKVELAVVVAHRCTDSNEISIAAYVAPSFVYLSELREYLTKALPKYMIPTFIKKIEVADFPMTLNGKIDRKRLEKDESVHEQSRFGGGSHLNETQLAIAQLWCTVLKLNESIIHEFHRQTSFSELGGNSLQLVLLQRTLEDKLHIQLSFTDLGMADTIEEFCDVIRRKKDMLRRSNQNNSNDLRDLRQVIVQDSILDPSIIPQHARRGSIKFSHFSAFVQKCSMKYPRNALMSGVTGFLGAYLLSELLEQTNAHVCCMVRESTEARGFGRIVENLRKYNLWKVEYGSRIAVVISDLSQENLGIAPDIYTALCNVIDVVFMNAAKMNFNTDYDDHKVANVDSTKEFIKFAVTGTQKYIFSTSSLSVFLFPNSPSSTPPTNRMCYETEFWDDPCTLEGGYGKSKWASEKLVVQALEYLPGGAIFRPARISGCSFDGAGPRNDLFASTLIGMTQLGSFPDMDFPYDLTPVDYVAKAMVEISLQICNDSNHHEHVYHLFNSQTIPFKDIFKGMGLKSLPLEQWRQELRNASDDSKVLIPFTPFFHSEFWDKAPHWPVFDTSNTDRLTSDRTKELLKPSKDLLCLYKTYFGLNTK